MHYHPPLPTQAIFFFSFFMPFLLKHVKISCQLMKRVYEEKLKNERFLYIAPKHPVFCNFLIFWLICFKLGTYLPEPKPFHFSQLLGAGSTRGALRDTKQRKIHSLICFKFETKLPDPKPFDFHLLQVAGGPLGAVGAAPKSKF